jgi:hypothetical protein
MMRASIEVAEEHFTSDRMTREYAARLYGDDKAAYVPRGPDRRERRGSGG